MKLKINKIWKTLVVVLAISTSAYGQQRVGQNGPQGNQHHQGLPPIPNSEQIEQIVNDLSKEISLTKEQSSKVLALHQSHFKTVEEKICSSRPKNEEMKKLKTDFENSIKVVLTKEQQVKYAAFLLKKPARKSETDLKNNKSKKH